MRERALIAGRWCFFFWLRYNEGTYSHNAGELSLTKYMSNEPTLGEIRVRTSFNVGDSSDVDKIKKTVAELINLVDSAKDKDPRLAAIACTSLEEAAMWAVKLVTTPQK